MFKVPTDTQLPDKLLHFAGLTRSAERCSKLPQDYAELSKAAKLSSLSLGYLTPTQMQGHFVGMTKWLLPESYHVATQKAIHSSVLEGLIAL